MGLFSFVNAMRTLKILAFFKVWIFRAIRDSPILEIDTNYGFFLHISIFMYFNFYTIIAATLCIDTL